MINHKPQPITTNQEKSQTRTPLPAAMPVNGAYLRFKAGKRLAATYLAKTDDMRLKSKPATSNRLLTGSAPELLLALQLEAQGIAYEREYRLFAKAAGGAGKGLRERLAAHGFKDWRFDFAFPEYRIACEIQGGLWTGGRHVTGKGACGDIEKQDAAIRLGWAIYYCHPRMVQSGQALETLRIMLGKTGK